MSAKDKVQDIILNQLKLRVNDSYKNNEKLTANSEHSKVEDIKNKAYLDTKISQIESQISYIKKVTTNIN